MDSKRGSTALISTARTNGQHEGFPSEYTKIQTDGHTIKIYIEPFRSVINRREANYDVRIEDVGADGRVNFYRRSFYDKKFSEAKSLRSQSSLLKAILETRSRRYRTTKSKFFCNL